MHYFSLDIEGFEFQILKTILLLKVDIKIIQVEMNHITKSRANDLCEYLKNSGHYLFERLGIDEMFLKRGFEVVSFDDLISKGDLSNCAKCANYLRTYVMKNGYYHLINSNAAIFLLSN